MAGRYQEADADAEHGLEHGSKNVELVYDAARVYGQVVFTLDTKGGLQGSHLLETRSQYQDRALELVRVALNTLPLTERESFWRKRVLPDPALRTVWPTPRFEQLRRDYLLPSK